LVFPRLIHSQDQRSIGALIGRVNGNDNPIEGKLGWGWLRYKAAKTFLSSLEYHAFAKLGAAKVDSINAVNPSCASSSRVPRRDRANFHTTQNLSRLVI